MKTYVNPEAKVLLLANEDVMTGSSNTDNLVFDQFAKISMESDL